MGMHRPSHAASTAGAPAALRGLHSFAQHFSPSNCMGSCLAWLQIPDDEEEGDLQILASNLNRRPRARVVGDGDEDEEDVQVGTGPEASHSGATALDAGLCGRLADAEGAPAAVIAEQQDSPGVHSPWPTVTTPHAMWLLPSRWWGRWRRTLAWGPLPAGGGRVATAPAARAPWTATCKS